MYGYFPSWDLEPKFIFFTAIDFWFLVHKNLRQQNLKKKLNSSKKGTTSKSLN